MISNPEIEANVLGGILFNPDVRDVAMARLIPYHFYEPKHRIIYESCQYFYQNNKLFNTQTIDGHLVAIGKIDQVGHGYVDSLIHVSSSYSTIETDCDLLVYSYNGRALMKAIQEVSGKLNAMNVVECIDELSEFVITNTETNEDATQGMNPFEIMEVYKDMPQAEQLFTGNHYIDNVMYKDGGLRRNQMCLTIADSSHGKTQYATMVHGLLERNGYKTAWFQLESTAEDTAKAIISIAGKEAKNVFIHDKVYDIDHIKRWARKHKKNHGLDAIVVDYVQNVECRSRGKKNENIEYISTQLTRLAKDLNVAAHLLSQVTIERDKRKGWNRFPRYNDVRDTQQLKQDAAVITGIFAPYMVDELQKGEDAIDFKDQIIDKRSKFAKQLKNRFGELTGMMEHYIHLDNGMVPFEKHRQETQARNNSWRDLSNEELVF